MDKTPPFGIPSLTEQTVLKTLQDAIARSTATVPTSHLPSANLSHHFAAEVAIHRTAVSAWEAMEMQRITQLSLGNACESLASYVREEERLQRQALSCINAAVCPDRFVAEAVAYPVAISAWEAMERQRIIELSVGNAYGLDASYIREEERLRQLQAGYIAQFYQPSASAIASLMEKSQPTPLAALAGLYTDHLSISAHAIASMHNPWVNAAMQEQSFSSFLELQGIGFALATRLPFDQDFANALRADLGDWRDPIDWSEEAFIEPIARTGYYVERGLNSALIDFPSETFQESLDIAGLGREPPPLEVHFGPPVPLCGNEEEESGFAKTNRAHDWIQRFESQIRRFIDEVMSEAFGPLWMRDRLPANMLDEWQEKKNKAEQNGCLEWPLIAYADFTDYEKIISKKENWRVVFQRWFIRPENARESLQRLYPIRISVMHSRPIGQADYLYLFAEVKRIMSTILPRLSNE